MPVSVSLRASRADDDSILREIYASTRAHDLARTAWTDEQRTAFLRMQFDAQYRHYRAHFPAAQFDLVVLGDDPSGQPIGRLYVDRRLTTIAVLDISLLPGTAATASGRSSWRRSCARRGRARAAWNYTSRSRTPRGGCTSAWASASSRTAGSASG